ncbi:MAG: hypothetical protein IKA71_04095 [Lentisphaeria bacterium]|nr:hypothetical protein [Lentisphaeria bacterium]
MDTQKALASARLMADWFVNNQATDREQEILLGTFYYFAGRDPAKRYRGAQWNQAFGLMCMLSAWQVFGDQKYLNAAQLIVREMRTLQIFNPFMPEHYGAIREQSAKCCCCYVRDSLSGAWGFLEYYRATGEREYLRRAELWAEWFLRKGMDETGWPLWGVLFEKLPGNMASWQVCNDMHGSFQGGCLNFFYHLYLETGDKKWVGGFFEHIADYFCSNIQQEDGFFRTIEKSTGKVPADDPQGNHHRGNDDLGTLGLLCAYRIYPKKSYLDAITKFLDAVFAKQKEREDGQFEESCAAVPVILNVIHEAADVLELPERSREIETALTALLSRQFPADDDTALAGGLNELAKDYACSRSTSYALLYLLKVYGGDDRFLRGK